MPDAPICVYDKNLLYELLRGLPDALLIDVPAINLTDLTDTGLWVVQELAVFIRLLELGFLWGSKFFHRG